MRHTNSVVEIYVDCKNGHDWFSGLTPKIGDSGPVKTIETALRHVTELRDMGYRQPITIYLMGDEYVIEKPVKVLKNMGSITFESYGDKKVILSGAKRIEGLFKTQFNGVDCLGAKVPDDILPSDVFVNKKRAELTRYPEEGYLYPVETGSDSVFFRNNSDWFICAEREEISKFSNLEDAKISFCHFWVDEHSGIESFDKDTGKVVMSYIPRYSTYSGEEKGSVCTTSNAEYSTLEYYIENVPEMFLKENQWYFDKAEKTVYYIPEKGTDITNIELYMPCVTRLFDIEADNVNFQNIEFLYTSSMYESREKDEKTGKTYASDAQSVCGAEAVLNFKNSKNCIIENCDFTCFGLYGIDINSGCHGFYVNGNRFSDCGAGGIKILGSNEPEDYKNYTYSNIISNNTILNCGTRHKAGCGILLMHSFENKILHNEIGYTYYTGISLGWVWGYGFSKTADNLIKKNHIHHIGQGALSDLGGIYLIGPQPDTYIKGNLIHDVYCRYYGGQAIYLDEGASYVTIENNICYNVYSNSINMHFGLMDVTRNNILEAGDRGALNHWRQEMHISEVEMRNILFSQNDLPIYGAAGEDVVTDNFITDNNLLFAYGQDEPTMYIKHGVRKYHEDAKAEHELDIHSIIADPCFKDFDNKDFTIDENSPARKIGFKNIDMTDVGPAEKHKVR